MAYEEGLAERVRKALGRWVKVAVDYARSLPKK